MGKAYEDDDNGVKKIPKFECHFPRSIRMYLLMALTASSLIALSTILTWQITYKATTESVLTLARLGSKGAISQLEEAFKGYLQLAIETRAYMINWYQRYPLDLTWDDLENSSLFLLSLLTSSIQGTTVATPRAFYISLGIGGTKRWVSNSSYRMYVQDLDFYGRVKKSVNSYNYYGNASGWYNQTSVLKNGEMVLSTLMATVSGVISLNLQFPLYQVDSKGQQVLQGSAKVWLYLMQTKFWMVNCLDNARRLYPGSGERSHFIYLFSREGVQLLSETISVPLYGPLLAVSHGNISFPIPPNSTITTPNPRAAHQSDDPVIASSADLLLKEFGSYFKINESSLLTMSISEGKYFVLSSPIYNRSIGLDLVVVQVTEQRVIMGKIEENNRLILFIVIFILIGSILLVGIISHLITMKLATLAQLMETHVSNMDFNNLPQFSAITTEVRTMQISFRKMCKTLEEYKAYLPNSIFATDEQPIVPEVNDVEVTKPKIRSADSKVAKSQHRSVRKEGKEGTSTESTISIRSKHHLEEHSHLSLSLTKRPMTIMMVTLPNVGMINMSDLPQISATTKAMDELVLKMQKEIKDDKTAIINSFGAGWIIISWKSISTVNSDLKACKLAFRLLSDKEVNYAVAISSSPVLTGNIGSSTLRTVTTLGPAVAKVRNLCSLSAAWGARAVVSDSVYQNTYHEIEMRPIDRVKWVSGNPELVYQLMEEKSYESDEWMYQLKVTKSPYQNCVLGFIALSKGEYDDAYQRLTDASGEFPTDSVIKYMLSLCERQRMASKTEYIRQQLPPFEIFDWNPTRFAIPFSI